MPELFCLTMWQCDRCHDEKVTKHSGGEIKHPDGWKKAHYLKYEIYCPGCSIKRVKEKHAALADDKPIG